MARQRDFKAEYAKRLERAKARGLSRQAARGHSPGEARRRAEREREEYGISKAEAQRVRGWAERRAREIHDSVFDPEEVVEAAQLKGWEWFAAYRDKWNEVRREYIAIGKVSGVVVGNLAALQALADFLDVEDLTWMYYH